VFFFFYLVWLVCRRAESRERDFMLDGRVLGLRKESGRGEVRGVGPVSNVLVRFCLALYLLGLLFCARLR